MEKNILEENQPKTTLTQINNNIINNTVSNQHNNQLKSSTLIPSRKGISIIIFYKKIIF